MATLRALEPFSFNDANGVPRNVSAGTLFDSADPNVKGRGHLFEPVEVTTARTAAATETASAAPGEVRARKPLTKRAAPKADDPEAAEGDG